jgi:hypothetical protein
MREKITRPSCYEPPATDELRQAIESVISEETISDEVLRLSASRIEAHVTDAFRRIFDEARVRAIVSDVSETLQAELTTPISLIRAVRADENQLVAWFAAEAMNRAWRAGLFFADMQGDWHGVILEEMDRFIFKVAIRLGLIAPLDSGEPN